MATRYTFTDDSGDVRISGFLTPEPAGTFNGGTITNALTIDTPTANPALLVRGGGDPVLDGNLIASLQAGDVAHTNCVSAFSDGTVAVVLDISSPGIFKVSGSGKLIEITGDNKVGFFNATPVVKPTVAGAKLPSDVVLASLLTALVALGLVVDNST